MVMDSHSVMQIYDCVILCNVTRSSRKSFHQTYNQYIDGKIAPVEPDHTLVQQPQYLCSGQERIQSEDKL